MESAASQAVFGYYTAALVAMACIALAAGIQFGLIGLRQTRDRMYLAFALECLCLAGLSLGNAWLVASQTLSHALAALHLMSLAASLSFPPFVVFVGRYTGRPVRRPVVWTIAAVSLAFAWANLVMPYTVLFARVSGLHTTTLPWGEMLMGISGEPSPLGWTFHLLTYTAFAWALSMSLRQYLRGERQPALLLGICLLIQFGALLWGDLVVDLMERPYPYIDAFSFLPFVLLMGMSMASQLHQRSQQLEQTTRHLRSEVETRRQAELSLRHLAYHDALTGLPNRARLLDRMSDMLADARHRGTHGAALIIDLDNFKTINDALGHHIGDRMLEAVADRLLAAAPLESAVARLGGDEFVIALGGLDADEAVAATEAQQTAADLGARLAAPVAVDNRLLAIGASIGVALFGGGDDHVADILRRADIALYRAKAAGRNAVSLFQPKMQRVADERMELERGLRTALERNEVASQFQLHFQPQLTMRGRLLGAEALLRWQHPTMGAVPPDTFIPIAEETGLIHALGAWVIAEACARIREWDTLGVHFGDHLAVNVSAWQLAHPHFVEQLQRLVGEAGVAPERLTLELTESALLQGFEPALETMRHLSSLGFRLALDDFGTGYSSLSYLRQLPLQELKIDRSFVNGLQPDMASPLAGFIVDVGRRLGMTTIAEGVETQANWTTLESLGCDAVQGYLICPPLDQAAFQSWLSARADAPPPGIITRPNATR